MRALVVFHDGRLVHERCTIGGSQTELHATFSVTKPIVGALVGIDIEEGRREGVGRKDRVVFAMFSRYCSKIDEDVFRDLAAFVGR